jgi:hypothetical protein
MLATLASTLLIVGLALLVIGQKKNKRSLVLIALVCFLFSLGMNDLVHGLVVGFNRG